MTHLHYASTPKGKSRRSGEKLPAYNKPMRNGKTRGSRVVVFEAAATARDIIRVSIETIDEARQERVIVF